MPYMALFIRITQTATGFHKHVVDIKVLHKNEGEHLSLNDSNLLHYGMELNNSIPQ